MFTDEIAAVARLSDGLSGADLDSLLRRAGYAAIRRGATEGVEPQDFELAKDQVRRSVSDADMKRYEKLRRQWGNT